MLKLILAVGGNADNRKARADEGKTYRSLVIFRFSFSILSIMALVNPLERFQGFIARNWKMRNGKSSMSNNFFWFVSTD